MNPRRLLDGHPALLLSLLSGSLMPLAFAPFFLWPLALLLPAVLIALWRRAHTAGRAFLLGWLFGLGWFGFGVYWLYNSLHDFGNAPPAVAGALTALMVLTLAAFIGALLMLLHRLNTRLSASWLLLAWPLGWFAMEWFKGWVLTGFPWLSLGYAQTESPLSGFAPLVGVYGIGALSILLSLCLWRLPWRPLPALAVILLLFAGGYLLQEREWTRAVGAPLRVVMVQGNIPQEMRWRPESRRRIIERYRQASEPWWGKTDLILWPEAAVPGWARDLRRDLLEPLGRKSRDSGTALMTGILTRQSEGPGYYNSMLLLGGGREQFYHKRHLVPFGEYFPLRGLIGFLDAYIDIPMSDMTPGPLQQPLMRIGETRLGVSICYEDVFSRDVNRDLPQANLLINTSNDAWFGDSLAPHQHLQIARMRAMETRRPLLRSSNTGPTAFIDHHGRITGERSGVFEFAVVSGQVQPRQGQTPFLTFARWQPWIAGVLLVVGLALAFWGRSSDRKEQG